MKGWVYVITNKAMSGIVKVGHSTKDPELRAKELESTGVPGRYEVEYDILIKELKDFRVDKEWFRCSVEEAVTAIKKVIENKKIYYERRCGS